MEAKYLRLPNGPLKPLVDVSGGAAGALLVFAPRADGQKSHRPGALFRKTARDRWYPMMFKKDSLGKKGYSHKTGVFTRGTKGFFCIGL